MEFSDYLIRIILSLLIVLGAVFVLIPFFLRKFVGLKGFGGKGSFEVKKVSPISKNVLLVELEIKGRIYILCVSERGADVIYREDEKDHTPPPASEPSGSGSGRGSSPD